MHKKLEKGLVYPYAIFIGQLIALTAFLNSNLEMSLKTAFLASVYVLRTYIDHTQMKSYRTGYYLAISNAIIHRDFSMKNRVVEDVVGEESAYDMGYLEKKIMENLKDDSFDSMALWGVAEYAAQIGISVAIVKYALPLL